MPAPLTSPEDHVNDALVRIGVKWRIGSIYGGSAPAKLALDIYSQTRDALLQSQDWGFAERDISLTLLKAAPPGGYVPPTVWTTSFPALPWRYEYDYPDDAIKVRSIRRSELLLPNYDPKPNVWRTANDNTLPGGPQIILCNVADAIAVYTAQVTDPLSWEPLFSEQLCAAIARRLAPALTNLDTARIAASDEVNEANLAEKRQGG